MKWLVVWLVGGVVFSHGAWALTVTFAGDYGANSNTRVVLQRVGAIAPDVHLALGDLSYLESSEAAWCKMVHAAVTSPVLLVPGNHETAGNDRNADIDKFARCLPYSYSAPMTGEYPAEYFFDAPAGKPLARFIMISPNLKFSDGRQFEYQGDNIHMRWLKSTIADARANHIPWVVVGMHKVCVTTEAKSCEIGEELSQALIAENVDVVMDGHVHAYERTHALSCMHANKFDPACAVVVGDNRYAKGSGTVFITAGTGGRPFRKLNSKDSEAGYFATRFGQQDDSPYGVGKLTIDERTLTHEFVGAAKGAVLDRFIVQKQ